MPTYNVTVELLVEANNQDEAWEIVATPFMERLRFTYPQWRNPIINEPEEVKS